MTTPSAKTGDATIALASVTIPNNAFMPALRIIHRLIRLRSRPRIDICDDAVTVVINKIRPKYSIGAKSIAVPGSLTLSTAPERGSRELRAGFIALTALMLPDAAFAQTTTTYTYDALGRLVASSNQTGTADVRTNIDYDAAGNRKTYRVSGAAAGGVDTGGGAGTPSPQRFVVVPLNGFTIIPLG